jgi:hypothetical protein
VIGDPCTGKDSEITFFAQSAFVFPVAGKKEAFIAMFDRWNKDNLRDSRYVWLPVQFISEQVKIQWRDAWDLSIFD